MPEEESCGATQDPVISEVKEAIVQQEKKVEEQTEAVKKITTPTENKSG
jgi:uncharacterized coiled-coil protein SlyX